METNDMPDLNPIIRKLNELVESMEAKHKADMLALVDEIMSNIHDAMSAEEIYFYLDSIKQRIGEQSE